MGHFCIPGSGSTNPIFLQGPAAVSEAGPGGVLRQEADQEGGGQRQVCGGSGPQETDSGQEDHEKHRQKAHTRSVLITC